jgi:N-hydroxyarylamine O-acetyltransferase
MDVPSYLKRIDYRGSLELTVEVLNELQYAHLLSVPFENLDIHLGHPILLKEAKLFEKLVTQRRGGFCYELNGLFAALLRELGFTVDLLSSRVYGDGDYGPEFDHLILRVRLEEDWLVDVGFGENFLKPLRLLEDREQSRLGTAYRLERRSADWNLLEKDESGNWSSSYRFTLQPRQLSDFEDMCRYHQTSPKSHFTQKRLCTRATPTGRITISDQQLIITENGQRRETRLENRQAYHASLENYFGISLLKP